jgi:hypothetical protein
MCAGHRSRTSGRAKMRDGDETFRRIFAAGLASVRAGSHRIARDPRGSRRWGPSIVLLPGDDLASPLAGLTSTAAEMLGGSHWLSGAVGRSHLTVRALEYYVEWVDPDRLWRYRTACERALDGVGPLHFEVGGIGISSGSVMVRAQPTTSAAEELRSRLGTELGQDGWLEGAFERDPIWYCSILHFAEPVTNVDQLVAWVDAQHDVSLGVHTFDALHICCWKHDSHGMVPEVAASIPAQHQG